MPEKRDDLQKLVLLRLTPVQAYPLELVVDCLIEHEDNDSWWSLVFIICIRSERAEKKVFSFI